MAAVAFVDFEFEILVQMFLVIYKNCIIPFLFIGVDLSLCPHRPINFNQICIRYAEGLQAIVVEFHVGDVAFVALGDAVIAQVNR